MYTWLEEPFLPGNRIPGRRVFAIGCCRREVVNLRERFGCFLLVIGTALLLMYAIPIVQAFQADPASVPGDWLGIALAAGAVSWLGVRLFMAGRKGSESRKPASLAARMYSRFHDEDENVPPH
jgi:hypothetical protein